MRNFVVGYFVFLIVISVSENSKTDENAKNYLINDLFSGDPVEQVGIETIEQLYEQIFRRKYEPLTRECKSDEFNCGNYCIPGSFACDGIPDCITLETLGKQFVKVALDEANCSRINCGNPCTKDDMRLKLEKKCIPYREVCDSDPNCRHRKWTHQNEDEIGCELENDSLGPIEVNAFRCKVSKHRMSRTKICDADWRQDVYAHRPSFSIYSKLAQRSCSEIFEYDSLQTFTENRVGNAAIYMQVHYRKCEKSSSRSVRNVSVRLNAKEVNNWMDYPIKCFKLSNATENNFDELWLRMATLYGVKQSTFILDDHSDEEGCPHARFEGIQIPPKKVTKKCSPQVDCGDGTCAKNKKDCEDIYRWTKCSPGSLWCNNLCVQLCDGICDCLYCEDEANCTKQSNGCLLNQHKCTKSGSCAPKNMFDDNVCNMMGINAKTNSASGYISGANLSSTIVAIAVVLLLERTKFVQ